jgi:hypothetical protein
LKPSSKLTVKPLSCRTELPGGAAAKERLEMGNEPIITLQCVRKSGRRERTRLPHHTLSEARELAKWVLHIGNDLYTEVDICIEDRTIETIQNLCGASLVGTN